MASDSHCIQSDINEAEEASITTDSGGEEGDLSTLGAASTRVKFHTVQQESFQRTEEGSERLAQQILECCQSPDQEIAPVCGEHDTVSTCNLTRNNTRVLQQKVNFIQVNQQFGDVSVKGTRNLTIGGTQNIGKSGATNDDSSLLTEKLQKRTISRIKSWTQGMVRTSALAKVLGKLQEGVNWITIKGSPGEGKTTVAYMALEEQLRIGKQVFQVTSPTEFTEVISACTQPIIMLDDIFGNLEFDRAKWLMWEEALHGVLDLPEHRSHEPQPTQNITVILVGRDYILNAASGDMGRMADFFTQDLHVVDMSHNVERNLKEKLAIWNAISESSDDELEQNTVKEICQTPCPHGFPHVCRLFLTIRKKNPKVSAGMFFKTPLEFLNQTIQKFLHDKKKLLLFKEMVKCDGKVTLEELETLDNSAETIQTAYDLVGTYLRKEDDCFSFDHPSIYDSVAFNIGKLYPLFVIEYCSLSFIHERLRLESSSDTLQDSSSKDSDLVVYIPKSYKGRLAERFATEISNRNLLQVLSHRAFVDEAFIVEVMSEITLPVNDLIKLIDKNADENFLSLIGSSKSPQLLMYLHNHSDIQLTKSDMNTILLGVCKYAASDVLNYLSKLSVKPDINVKHETSRETSLMIASKSRDSQFVQYLLSFRPDLTVHSWNDATVLHYLCENGIVSVLKEMIDKGTDIDITNVVGQTPLYYACQSNQVEVVRLLLDSGATIDGKAVSKACEEGNMQIVRMLFETGATVNMASDEGPPMYSACFGGKQNVMRYLIGKGASVNDHGDKARLPSLHIACFCNKLQAIQCLLEFGADINSKDRYGDTPLHTAAESDSEECVDLLLKAGADVNIQNTDGITTLHKAARSRSKGCIELALKAGADLCLQNKDGYTPLHSAAESGSHVCVYLLLKAGADVNVASKDGFTPLLTAVGRAHYKCIELLVKAGADVNVRSHDRTTALYAAVGKRSPKCVDLLLQAGADVNALSKGSLTPLHAAVYYKDNVGVHLPSMTVCETLINHSANVNQQDREGNTPLHLLCRVDSDTTTYRDWLTHQSAYSEVEEYRSLVILLIISGADVNIRNNKGKPALSGWCKTLVPI